MAFESGKTKICNTCDLRRDIDDFRRYRRDGDERHSQCNECRNLNARMKSEKATRSEILAMMREIRRSRTVDRVAGFLDEFAARLGGKNKLIAMWVDLLKRQDAPVSFRVATINTVMHAGVCVDMHRVAGELDVLESEEPIDAVRKLHKSGRLFPGLHEMCRRGELTLEQVLDGVDPAPT